MKLCAVASILLLISCPRLSHARTSHARSKYLDVNDNPAVNVNGENNRPIVGILAQEVSNFVRRKYPVETFESYIAASYVKFVEGAGGRVVPIWIGKSREYYEDILSKINGVLLPGGATYFNQSDGYADAGKYIYSIAVKMNERNNYMPIWGTCLGFELLLDITANDIDVRTDCSSSSQALPLEFTEGYEKSRLFRNASNDLIQIFKTEPVTANFHIFCVTQETFAKLKLDKVWTTLSINHDWNGIEFISSVEHTKYPFYGVQFHPEKNLYEFIENRNITHTESAIRTSQYFADFIVNEARKNKNRFLNTTEEREKLIYNYNPRYTGALGSAFVQQYLFEHDSNSSDGTANQERRGNGGAKTTSSWLRSSTQLIGWLILLRLSKNLFLPQCV